MTEHKKKNELGTSALCTSDEDKRRKPIPE
jgi:hypothetical protein